MRRRRFVLFALLALAFAPFAGCSGSSDSPCTELGCSSFVAVTLANPPAPPYRVEIVLPGGGTRTFECPDAGACQPARFVFPDVTPEEITVRVTRASGVASGTVRPVYNTVQPNGPRCQPTCRQGEVTVQLTN